MAGSETTSTLMNGVTYILLTHPEAMEKLKHEVRSEFKSAEDITITSVSRLPYMLACLNEALRLYPPVPGSMVRVVGKGGGNIAGHFVPEGTKVECQQWSMNHSTTHWTDPWEFRPERYLGSEKNRDTRDALQPFNVGPRDCAGRGCVIRAIFDRVNTLLTKFFIVWRMPRCDLSWLISSMPLTASWQITVKTGWRVNGLIHFGEVGR